MPDFLSRKEGIKNTTEIFLRYSWSVVAHDDRAGTIAVFSGYGDGGLIVGKLLLAQGVDGVLNKIEQDLRDLVGIGVNSHIFREVLYNFDVVLDLTSQKTKSRLHNIVDGSEVSLPGIGMSKGSEVGNNIGDAVDAILDVSEDILEFFSGVWIQALSYRVQDVESGLGVVERIIYFMDNSGAESSQ